MILGEAGNTIAELLAASFLSLLVLSVVFSAVRAQGRSAAIQSGAADAHLTIRGASEILLSDLRMAGYGMLAVPPASGVPPIEVTRTSGATTLVLRGNFSNATASLAQAAVAGASNMVVTPSSGSGSFRAGNRVVVDSGLASEVKTVTGVAASGSNLNLSLDTPLARSYPIGPDVAQVESVTYDLSGGVLRRSGQVLADDVTSFDLVFIDQAGTQGTTPGTSPRSVILSLAARQAAPSVDAPKVASSVSIEAHLRNLAMRWDAG
ncbi:MAG: hypothetical protein ACKOCT_20760 [Alphaproteobacteria bacterium]